MKHRVQLEVNLSVLKRNYRKITERAKPSRVLCVVKANAYGLGAEPYVRTLAAAGCRDFGFADTFEAEQAIKVLRKAKCHADIQILSSILPDEIPSMVKAGVILPIIDLATARLISNAAVRAKKIARVQFKLDTGMGRLGILWDAAPETIRMVEKLPNLSCEGIFTHFPVASDPENPFTSVQIKRFKDILADLARDGITFKRIHCAASDGINNFPEAAKIPFNQVRAGIVMHGAFEPFGRKKTKVESVLTLKTRIAQVRDLPAGTTIGYGRTWCLRGPARIATLTAGYADGLPLALTNRGHVLIGGKPCPIVGRISMDYTTVDVSSMENVQPGDEAILLGRSGSHAIEPDDWAELMGTHAYNILCNISPRVERTYTK